MPWLIRVRESLEDFVMNEKEDAEEKAANSQSENTVEWVNADCPNRSSTADRFG